MRVEPIDGFFGENLIVFGGLHRGGFISRGFEITAPDLENADPVHHNVLESDLVTMLTILKGDWGMQIQWMPDSDFRRPLQRYRSETMEHAANDWERRQRNERFVRFMNMGKEGLLRRERLRVYFTLPADEAAVGRAGQSAHEALIAAYAEQFNQIGQFLQALFSGSGGTVQPMTDSSSTRSGSSSRRSSAGAAARCNR
jgi:type IV secretion system protein TrbE